jgi:hypothetical protein
MAMHFPACRNGNTEQLQSPDKKLSVRVSVRDGQAGYEIMRNDTVVLEFSKLGIRLENKDFSSNLKLKSVSPVTTVSESYAMLSGKKSQCAYTASQQIFTVENKDGDEMKIIFQAANDGVAFCYEMEKTTDLHSITIKEESTGFHFSPGTKAWLHPRTQPQSGWLRTQPSCEENYQQEIPVGEKSTYGFGWLYPALFRTANAWVLISETDLTRNYGGTHLSETVHDGEYKIEFPEKAENIKETDAFFTSELPFRSPWRLLIIGDLATIVASTLATDFSSPPATEKTDFIQSGVASWSWALLGDKATIYDKQKEFIDFAAAMNWQYCLIDALWDQQIGYEKIAELAHYAKSRQVGIWLWYNSAGDWNGTPQTPHTKMLDAGTRRKEMQWLRDTGIKGIKVDFFAGDGQSTTSYYQDILADASEYGLMVNFHGATIPRGWSRTYPNLMSMEAVKGFEYITFEQANADLAPTHCCLLPFTRNVIGSMDFTPVCFSEINNIRRITSNAFELALSILFESGIQHIVETPQGMKNIPGKVQDLLKGLPAAWDETRLLAGYPGKYAVIARRKGTDWYIGGINGQNQSVTVELDIAFLGKDTATVITSGPDNRNFFIQSLKTEKITWEIPSNDGITIF